MILGMTTATFTTLHVLISLVGIASGLVVMYGLLTANRLEPLDDPLSGKYRRHQHHGVPVPIQGSYAGDRDRCPLADRARVRGVGPVCVEPDWRLASDLYCGRLGRFILQRVRVCGAVL